MPNMIICDFCSCVPVHAIYSAYHPLLVEWSACKPCAKLIDSGKWEDLLDKSEQAFIERHGRILGLRQLLASLHGKFKKDTHSDTR